MTLQEYEDLVRTELQYRDLKPGDTFYFDEEGFDRLAPFFLTETKLGKAERTFECRRLFSSLTAGGTHTNYTKVIIAKCENGQWVKLTK